MEETLDYILEISFRSSAALEERLHALLWSSESAGSSSEEREGETTVSAYFATSSGRLAARQLLASEAVTLREIDRPRQDWLKRYQQSLAAMEIGERFLVAPDRSLVPARHSRIPLIVPQEQAFGTGSHETTALCLESLEEEARGRDRGLDIGAGSGILALAMIALGVPRVLAFDNDRDAYAALRDNRHRNGITPQAMPLLIGTLECLRDSARFDLVTMNIVPEVIIPSLPRVRALLRGTLILSGVLLTRRGEVIDAARGEGLRLLRERSRGEWWCGTFA